ncbi:MAG TPA: thiamine pyrophosphate-dependent enzyme, partial [Bacteroidales bacterium]|nr:thiamine pyrophosphate-dependent enzyme [Bacteroidales bacterium]
PGSKIVCITGDGGFLMSAGELLTARRLKIPVIIVVLSDGELNLIKIKQSWQGLEPNSTVLYEGDLFGSDSFLGIKVYRATSEKTLIKALQAASDATVPVIINAVIDSTDYDDLIVRQ